MSLTRAERKKLRSLKTRKGRRAAHLFLAEGVRLLEAALRSGTLPRSVYSTARLTGRGRRVLDELRAARVTCEEVEPHELASLADTETPQGLVAVFEHPDDTFASRERTAALRLLVCDGVADPGNLGTLIRSAAAFDFELMVLIGASADAFSPKVVRSSDGAIFCMPIVRSTVEELMPFLEAKRLPLVATARHGSSDGARLREIAAGCRLALAIGSENEGLSAAILERAALTWRIPHGDAVESLNAAVAGSIAMREVYEAAR